MAWPGMARLMRDADLATAPRRLSPAPNAGQRAGGIRVPTYPPHVWGMSGDTSDSTWNGKGWCLWAPAQPSGLIPTAGCLLPGRGLHGKAGCTHTQATLGACMMAARGATPCSGGGASTEETHPWAQPLQTCSVNMADFCKGGGWCQCPGPWSDRDPGHPSRKWLRKDLHCPLGSSKQEAVPVLQGPGLLHV